MNCRNKASLYRWLDEELKGTEKVKYEAHFKECLSCQKEAEATREFNVLLRSAVPQIEPSQNFDSIFWKKVLEREKKPWLSKAFERLDDLIPTPSFSQAFAILLMALLIGGTGGAVSGVNHITPDRIQGQRVSIQYLSGFHEFKGIPASSVAATYLKTLEERNPSS